MVAAGHGHADIVAFLLTLPAVREGIDSISWNNKTALWEACFWGRTATIQLLLDAGANPTIPEGDCSPLSIATAANRHDIVALFRPAIEQHRLGLLHKARCLVDASYEIRKAQHDNRSLPEAQQRAQMVDAAPSYLQQRVAQAEPLPAVRLTQQEDEDEAHEKRQATLAYVLGLGGGAEEEGMPHEMFVELVDWIMPPPPAV